MTDTPDNPYADLAAHADLPRTTSLAAAPDGSRVVAQVQRPDAARGAYVSALWELPLDGAGPRRLTWSDEGETDPAVLPDGTVLFASRRPAPGRDARDGAGDGARIWALPPAGEARVFAERPGGLSVAAVASATGRVVVAGSVLGDPDGDAERRQDRERRRISGVLHTGMPIRFWDHELGPERPALLAVEDDGSLRDLAPDAGRALLNATCSLSADGSRLATTWRASCQDATFPYGIAVVDVSSGQRAVVVAPVAHAQVSGPELSPDGGRIAVLYEYDGDRSTPWTWALRVHDLSGAGSGVTAGAPVTLDIGDLFPTQWRWTPDGSTLVVSGDLHGGGAVLAVDPATGQVRRTLDDSAAHTSLSCVIAGGRAEVLALRSGIDAPPAPVRLPVDAGATADPVPDPAPVPAPPGRLEQVEVEVDGSPVRAWLCLPPDADTPAPVMLWIHGGPFASYNSWSWRWNPWLAVAAGWAVVLPDPALSTGWGQAAIDRAWPYRADVVWHECEAALDAVVTRPDVDGSRQVLAGASFGGFMANWIAGHSDRFEAIVTHAGLWAADQQHTTTDAAAFKTHLFGRPEDNPSWYEQYSPHRFADRISTPILISHGNRDHRVPVSESLRMWFDLVEGWTGEPDRMPHRFLQFTGENHWVLGPSNHQLWWETILGFVGHHALGRDWIPSPLL